MSARPRSGVEIFDSTIGQASFNTQGKVLTVTNALTVGGGTVTLDVLHTGPISSGTYNLATLGSFSGSAGNIVLGTIQGFNAGRQQATLNKSASALTLSVTGAVPIWHGQTSTNWSTSTSDNAWSVNGADSFFLNADDVLFDDTGASGTVNVVGAVVPNSVTLDNGAVNYAFTGVGKISGVTGLVKTGPGTLIIDNSGNNDFAGNLTISAGTVQVGNNDTKGNLPTTGTWDNEGTLAFSRSDNLVLSQVISGAGSLVQNGNGKLTLSSAQAYTGSTIASKGTLAISPSDASPDEAPREGDLETARLHGKRVAEFAKRLRG